VLREASVAQVLDAGAPVLPSAMLLAEVANALAEPRTDAAVVVDTEGRPLGLVTAGDVLRAAHVFSERVSELAVCHALSGELFKVRADAPLGTALALFQDTGARHAVAVADDGTVAGLVRPGAVLAFLTSD
jgi:signal-transduction protein with cAMP-binding, CBS, and nucleotidyltransferase domain